MPSQMEFPGLGTLDSSAVLLILITVVVFAIPIFILFPPLPVESFDVLGQTHSRIGIVATEETAHYRQRYQQGRSASSLAVVESLWIYPIKSCAGIELSRSKVLPTGLEYDRLFTFAGWPSGKPEAGQARVWQFRTQRQLPLLANVKVEIWLPDESKNSRALGRPHESFVVVKFPWRISGWRGVLQDIVALMSHGIGATPLKEFILPLEFPSKAEQDFRGYSYDEVKIWKETTIALNMSADLPPELAQYLGAKEKLGLFRMDPERQREVFRCAPKKETLGYQPIVDFHDAYPLHLLNVSSTNDLENKIEKDKELDFLDPRRFRANIIVTGPKAYDEDEWRRIRCHKTSGSLTETSIFDVSCRTVRCKMPNVNPDDGGRHYREPDHALRKHRDVDEGAPKLGCLGVQMCPIFENPTDSTGRSSFITVGMQVEVLERGYHKYIKQ